MQSAGSISVQVTYIDLTLVTRELDPLAVGNPSKPGPTYRSMANSSKQRSKFLAQEQVVDAIAQQRIATCDLRHSLL